MREVMDLKFIDGLKLIALRNANFFQLKRARSKLSWLIRSSSDISVIAKKLAQLTETKFEIKYINMFSKAVEYLIES